MTRCGSCNKFLTSTGGAVCSKCLTHYHKHCAGVVGISLSSKWLCYMCSKSGIRHSPCPVTNEESADNKQTLVLQEQIFETQNEDPHTLISELILFREEMTKLRKDISVFRKDINDLRYGLNNCKTEVVNMNNKVDAMEQRLSTLESRGPYADNNNNNDGDNLLQKICNLNTQINERDQSMLSNDVVITGVPEIESEDVLNIVKHISFEVGSPLNDVDIVEAYRIGKQRVDGGTVEKSKQRTRPILVRLAKQQIRNRLLREARTRQSDARAIAGSRFYLNERLTRENQRLLVKAKAEARKNKWKYAWTNNGRVFVRKSNGMDACRISCDLDIEKCFNNPNQV